MIETNNSETRGPKSLGVIMDGNRRWAKEKGLPIIEGHRVGAKKLEELCEWAREQGVEWLTVYAFSTENWNRVQTEVQDLLEVLEKYIDQGLEKLNKESRVRFIGDRSRFSETMQAKMARLEEESANGKLTLVIALSYGGRAEIMHAVNEILKTGAKDVNEESFAKYMYTQDMPDPDLIIRTGGEKRLSNFLPWQSVYSELFFTATKWPAFTKEEFDSILAEYVARERRHGK